MDFKTLMAKEQRKNDFNNNRLFKWLRKNRHKVMRVVLFPIWIAVLLIEKYKDRRHKSLVFTEEYCKKCLDKMISKLIIFHKEDPNCFLISDCDDFGYITFDELYGFNSRYYLEKHGCKREIRFTRKFYKMVEVYIMDEYRIDGYHKMTMNSYKEWKEAKDKFDWGSTPYSCDGRKGVVFYKE